jgi:Copper type II ascorbate-dependent monooxygenase, C-terminal domain
MLAGVAILALALTAGGVALANNTQPANLTPARADNFRLNDNHGFAQDLRRLVDVKAIVLVTQVNGDTGSRKAAMALEAMTAAHPDVAFLMLNSTAKTRAEIASEAAAQKISVPILHDDLQLAGEQLGVSYAGEAFVIEPKTLKILYHGPIDASGAAGPAKGYLNEALSDVLAGRSVASPTTAGKGTPIAFPERDRRALHASISYVKDIAPVLEEKCVACHQTGGIGPFAMSDYNAVKAFAPMIREAIRTRTMPPWHPDPTIGKFEHDGSLSADQVRNIVHWVEAGSPRGEGADPLAAKTHTAPDWPLGKPDLVIDVPSYTVPASGVVDYQYPVASNPMTEGRWVKAATLLPGDRQATHHILSGYMSKMSAGGAASTMQWEASYGEYAVGGESLSLPEKVGIMLPAGGGMGFQMHYTPYGKEAVDKSKIGFYFYPKGQEPDRIMRHYVIADNLIEIPPGEDNHKEVAYATFPKDALLSSVFLHTHYRGRAGSLELVRPDGSREMLISLPRYDFNWQRTYTFTDAVKIPAGSKVVATYWYDNSVRNPANPDPTKTIVWGPQSWEEMHYTSLYYQWTDETVAHPADATPEMKAMPRRIMGALDTSLDGMVQRDELPGRVSKALTPHFADIDANKNDAIDLSEMGGAMKYLADVMASARGGRDPTP